jgi:hypothetical protein
VTDNDGDGYDVDGICGPADCDDNDPEVWPLAAEKCDGKDTNCDGWWAKTDVDVDNDGVPLCANDCDDTNPATYPGAPEVCDGLDNNCNGVPDNEELDEDNDGYVVCEAIPDCDDNDPYANPAGQEWCSDGKDNDCDGVIDEAACICPDVDNDGQFADFCGGTDCDDLNAAANLGAVEACTDGVDNDCDGLTDCADPDAQNCPPITDNDGDGYDVDGICGAADCNDNDPAINPGATEICDSIDNNCDGWVPPTDVDNDGDTYSVCEGDCDDNDPDRHPNASEQCNGIDDDCDGSVPLVEQDVDGDGFRVCDVASDCDDDNPYTYPGQQEWCSDAVDNNCDLTVDEAGCICPDVDGDQQLADFCGGTDCNDLSSAAYAGAEEDCTDGIDNDCDGFVDIDDPDAVNCPLCTDNDNDGFATEGGGCGVVDCDDTDTNVNPDAPEICDGKDSDCDGWAAPNDVDQDGDGYAICAGDCNDNDSSVNPGVTEGPLGDPTCSDSKDNDCDGLFDNC